MSEGDRKVARLGFDGSVSSSTGLRIGAVLLVLGTAVQLGFAIATAGERSIPPPFVMIPWWLFIIAMLILGVAYLALAWQPFIGASGWLPGTAHLLQATFLAIVIYAAPRWAGHAVYLSLIKYTVLIVFANRERRYIHKLTRFGLVAVSLAEIAKVMGRTFVGDAITAAQPLDLALLLAQAIVVWRLAAEIAYHEDRWATYLRATRSTSFAMLARDDRRAP